MSQACAKNMPVCQNMLTSYTMPWHAFLAISSWKRQAAICRQTWAHPESHCGCVDSMWEQHNILSNVGTFLTWCPSGLQFPGLMGSSVPARCFALPALFSFRNGEHVALQMLLDWNSFWSQPAQGWWGPNIWRGRCPSPGCNLDITLSQPCLKMPWIVNHIEHYIWKGGI